MQVGDTILVEGPRTLYPEGQRPAVKVIKLNPNGRVKVRDSSGFEWWVNADDCQVTSE